MSKAEEFVCISCVDEVRYSFVSHLSEALRRKGISEVVVDVASDDLLSKESQAKIEKARVSVMVLPANCEPTKGVCRDNFLMVLECQRIVVPVLYGDSPLSGVWFSALDYIGLSPIHHSRKECSDSELVEEIVRDVYEKLFYTGRIGIYPKLLEIENMVNKQPIGIRCVGIWGMPGIGKTTLAKAVFDQMSGDFDACCFIEDYDKSIREKGLYRLLEEQLFKEKPGNDAPITKLSSLRDRLNNKRVLVVLDDVRNALVAESFLEGFDWLRPESLIIITSRDKQVFRLCRINLIYELQGLNEKEALQLFLLCASLKDMGEQVLHELSAKVINYANGNPLAISIYGRELKGKIKLSEMEAAFLKLKRRPPFKIVDAFKSSYDTLSDNEKNIFLDIACFFQGENVDYVIQLLEGCGFFPHVGIDVLVEKCLVTISENRVRLHNLTQDVGREIINGETVQIERRRRLWEPWSIKYLLEYNEHKANGEPKTTFKRAQGFEEIEGMFLDTANLRFDVQPSAFKNMLNLRLLKIYCSNPEVHPVINFPEGFFCSLPNELRLLHWENYPLQSLPQSFYPRHLVEINMPYSQLQKLWGGTKNLEMLRTIRLCHSQHLIDIDDLLKAPNLEVIDLQGCTRLQNFPASGHLLHLRVVNLSGCIEIKSVPEIPPNIETLHLQGTGILALPLSTVKPNHRQLVNFLTEIPGLSEASKLEHLKSLLESSSSCQDLGKLVCLALKDCSCLQSLPNMANLDLLKVLDLSGCSRLNSIQGFPRFLKELYLADTAVREVPKIPQSLELLNAHGSCLRSLPNMANLEFLKVLDLSGCSELETIQGFPRNLKELYFAGTLVREVPQLPLSLELLNAHGSVSLKSIRSDSEKLPLHYSFSNLFDLSPQVVNDFLVKALTSVRHIPRDLEFMQELNEAPTFSFSAPSNTKQKATLGLQPGSSVMARLNPSWRNTLMGFGMLVEVAFLEDDCDATGLGISCVCRWNNKEGRSYRIERNLHCWAPGKVKPKVGMDHTFVFCDVNMRPSTGEGNNPDIWADLVLFEFYPINQQTKCLNDRFTVTRCGVRVINVAAGNTSLEKISPVLSLDPMEVSGSEAVEEVLRVNYDELQEMDKVLFLYIASLFNAEDVDLVAPLIAGTDLNVSSGLKVLADVSLISVSPNGEIVMHYLLRQMGKEILHGQSMLLFDSQSSMTDKPSSILEQLLSNPDCYYSDAEIIVDRVPVGVHRCILAARSKFFQELFKKEKKNSKTGKPKYQLKKMLPYGAVGHEAFLYFLSYIYTRRLKPFPLEVSTCVDLVCPHDSCRPAVDFVVQLMYASSILQVPELVSYFQRRLCNFVDKTIVENVLPILMVAFNCKLPQLLDQCIERVARSDLDRFCIEKEVPPEVAEKIKQIRLMSPQDEETSPKISEKLLKKIGKILKALDSDDVELVKLLLSESDITLDQANGLHYSVVYSDPKVVAEILALGMGDVNYRNSRGYTVLHFAAIRRDPSIIISLIDKGANASEFTFDGRSAVNILRRLTNPKDCHTKTAEGHESSKAQLCIDILEREIRKNPMVLDTPLRSLSMPEDLQMKLLYLEKRVGVAQILFPTEAKVAMDIGNVEGTSEFTGLLPPLNGLTGNLSQVDLNETPHMQTQRLLTRMEALMKTVETGRRFFPYASEVLDKYMAEYIDDDILNEKGTTQERRLKRMRYSELKDDVHKAYSKDKEAKIARSCRSAPSFPSSSSSSITDDLKNTT